MSDLLRPGDPLGQRLEIGGHVFPGAWRYIMPPEFLRFEFPKERESTCMSCPKAAYDGYRKDYRCCTYLPRVPNFLLGLANETPEGRPAVERLLARGMLTPEGLALTPQQWIDYLDDLEHDRFGRSEVTLCPMLDQATGFCNIHPFRNAVCSTFFCRKDHGDRGEAFWEAVQALAGQMEMALSQWALSQIGFDVDAYVARIDSLAPRVKEVATADGGWTAEALDVMWGEWRGRELELLTATARVISEHRDVLWEAAREQPIVEAARFDRAMTRAVPKRLKDQIDPTDLESGVPMTMAELWANLERAYTRLWRVDERPYQLSGKLKIEPNREADPEAQANADKPFVAVMLARAGGSAVDWRVFLTADEAAALEAFRAPTTVSWRLLASPVFRKLGEPRAFLAEWLGRKALVHAR